MSSKFVSDDEPSYAMGSDTNINNANNANNANNKFYNSTGAKKSDDKSYVAFWGEDPNVILKSAYIMELFPTDDMTYNQKLNAITRLILLVTLATFLLKQSYRILMISAITVGAIYLLHSYNRQEHDKQVSKSAAVKAIKETFTGNPATDYLTNAKLPLDPNIFSKPDSVNPYGNVMLPDYEYNVNKKPAPPAFSKQTSDGILNSAKQLVQEANPGQPDIADKLFMDMNEELNLEQSMRQFVSNPSTTIPNDQGAFAEFCYGSMVSCKEGNAFACARNLSRYTN